MSSRFGDTLYLPHWELADCLSPRAPTMDLAELDHVSAFEALKSWLSHNGGRSMTARLPFLTYEAAGGAGLAIVPVAAAWQATCLAVKLFDDVEDGDVVEHVGEATNTATVLLFVAQAAMGVLASTVPASVADLVQRSLNRAMLRACIGQQADLVGAGKGPREIDPDAWLRIAAGKSGALLAWAARAGAVAAGCDPTGAAGYHAYGHNLGILLQVADDFNGIWSPSGRSDLRAGCLSLPVCYALHVSNRDDREALLALLARVRQGSDEAETRARGILTDLGAQVYSLAVARIHYQEAVSALDRAAASEPGRRALKAALDTVLPALTAVGGFDR